MFTTIIVNAIRMGTILLFGCVGEMLTEKVGNLNLGIPGIMCIGATGGCLMVALYGGQENMIPWVLVLLSILGALVFSGLAGLLYSFLTVSLKSNQNVTGLALTTFGVGFMKFFAQRFYDQGLFTSVAYCYKSLFGIDDKAENPLLRIFLSHGILVYLAIVVAIVAAFVLKKTRVGLYMRAVGENPATADAVGINVTAYKYVFITIGSAISGLGGLYYVMDRSSGTTFAEAAIDSFGWLAVALVIASMWKPLFAIVGSIVFGGLSILGAQLKSLNLAQTKLFTLVPFLITVLVLIVTSVVNKKDNQPPASLGVNYYREDR